jgi:ferredoxin
MTRIQIDAALCTGHGLCFAAAPSLFVDDDRGYGHVRGDGEVPESVKGEAETAIGTCPERAISWVR